MVVKQHISWLKDENVFKKISKKYHLHSICFTQKLGNLVPHNLNDGHMKNSCEKAAQNLTGLRATRCHLQRFVYRIVIEDEVELLLNMKQRKKSMASGDAARPRVKPDLHLKNTIICI